MRNGFWAGCARWRQPPRMPKPCAPAGSPRPISSTAMRCGWQAILAWPRILAPMSPPIGPGCRNATGTSAQLRRNARPASSRTWRHGSGLDRRSRHSGARSEPGISRFRVRCFASPRNDHGFGPRSPFSHSWYATTAVQPWGILSVKRATCAIIGLLLLAGCSADVKIPDQPAMYLDMAQPGATLDPVAAAIMISQYRQNNGLGTVVVDPELTKLAEQQSQAMAARNKMDHNVKGPLEKRLGASGYPATLAVGNVSAGYHTLAEAFSVWRDSPPHKANMLKNGVTKLGIAAAYAPNTKYKVFWTLILAST